MKRSLAAIALAFPLVYGVLPAAAQEPEWVETEVYMAEVAAYFDQCMTSAIEAGAPPTNGLYLNCLPNSTDVRNVLEGTQPITGMVACVDWSLAAMAGIIGDELMSELNNNTRCETEGLETMSLYEMWQWVRESDIEPYGI